MLEVIMIVGPTSIGKSTEVDKWVKLGYQRVNRDSIGGKIVGLLPIVESHLRNNLNVVLDNTHLTPKLRQPFLELAKKHKAKIKAVILDTSIEEAQMNFCLRAINNGIDITDINSIKDSKSPNIFLPSVMFRHFKDFIKPTIEEGFDEVIDVKFERVWPSNKEEIVQVAAACVKWLEMIEQGEK